MQLDSAYFSMSSPAAPAVMPYGYNSTGIGLSVVSIMDVSRKVSSQDEFRLVSALHNQCGFLGDLPIHPSRA